MMYNILIKAKEGIEMKSSYKVRAIKFLDQILPYIKDNLDSLYFIKKKVQEYNVRYHRNVRVCNGACRIVLVTSDYVIKWDYSNNVKTFGGNIEELKMYEIAKMEGFAYLLAEPMAQIRNNVTFIIMRRFEVVEKDTEIEYYVDEEEYDWLCCHIGDIHDNNFVIVDGAPIIIDYACGIEESTSLY